jgi:hypothetical protein
MTSKKPYWIELSDADQPTSRPRKTKRTTPFVAVVTAGFAIVGCSLLLNTHEEPAANASVSAISITTTPASPKSILTPQSEPRALQKKPAISPVAQSNSALNNPRSGDEGRDNEGENNDD